MTEQEKILDKLRKLEAIFTGTNYDGERFAAGVAMEKLHERLKSIEAVDPPVEYKFTMSNMWSRKLFVALLRRYGLKPYRYPRQRHTTVMVRVSAKFVDQTLWPEFDEIDDVLIKYLEEVTERLISSTVFVDTSEAETRNEPPRLN